MSNYVKFAGEAGDQYLTALAQGQEAVLKSFAAYAAVTPSPTQVPAFLASLPSPQEVAEANFAFASKLLKQQKEFTDKLLASAEVPEPVRAKGSSKS